MAPDVWTIERKRSDECSLRGRVCDTFINVNVSVGQS